MFIHTYQTKFVWEFLLWNLTNLNFPSKTGYHRFNYPMYRFIEKSFIESIMIRLVTNNGENVRFEASDMPSIVNCTFKSISHLNNLQFVSCKGSI